MTSSKPNHSQSPHLKNTITLAARISANDFEGDTEMQSGTATYTGTPVKLSLETFKNIFWLALLCLGYEGEVLPRDRGGNRGTLLVAAKLETGFLSCERVGKFGGAVASPGHQLLWRKAWRFSSVLHTSMAVGQSSCYWTSLFSIFHDAVSLIYMPVS